jgi:hypothetical protein
MLTCTELAWRRAIKTLGSLLCWDVSALIWTRKPHWTSLLCLACSPPTHSAPEYSITLHLGEQPSSVLH